MLLVSLLALALYLPFQSISLDDFDSYNFARALIEFDPAAGMPHPPGYVLYIGMGRLALSLTGDPQVALVALSTGCAAVACGLLFATASLLFSPEVARYSVALVICTPVMWLNANKALSDAPALCIQTLCMWCLAMAVRHSAPLWLVSACLGIAAGFRPQAILGLTLAFLTVAGKLRPRTVDWLAAIAAAIGTALTWLVPLLAAFGWSAAALQRYLSGATSFVTSQESLFATAVTTRSLAARWQTLWHWDSQAIFGPISNSLRIPLFVGTLLLLAIASVKGRRQLGYWLCIAWLAPQAALHVLFLEPSLTRYLLAMLFPVAILIAVGLVALPFRPARLVAILLFLVLVGSGTAPLAHGLHTQLSPPEQLADYLPKRLRQDQTLIVARQSYNALSYHLPGWDVRFLDYYGEEAIEQELASRQPSYIAIVDPEGLRPNQMYVEIETRLFARDPQIHAKHARVEVNIFGRADQLGPRDYALPEAGTIWIGTPQDGKYVLDGWYRREDIAGVPARWTGPNDLATLRVFVPQNIGAFTIRALSFAPGQMVELLCNDQLFARAPVPQDWSDISAILPAYCIPEDGVARLGLRPLVQVSPAHDGQSTDKRTLGIAVSAITFSQ